MYIYIYKSCILLNATHHFRVHCTAALTNSSPSVTDSVNFSLLFIYCNKERVCANVVDISSAIKNATVYAKECFLH